MKRKILLISSMLLTLSLITIVIFNNKDNSNTIISNITKEEPVINSNMITMMYETEAGSGEYIETKDNTWPETGYIFNDILSGCENGGELEYNSGNNTVNLLSNSSDQCYVYFDKYDGVWIDNVSITNVTGSSVTLDVSATSENGSITTYYYALNDSEEYIESTTNPITINDLNKLTEYRLSIYAVDSTNAKSNIYELTVSTTDETGPVINFALINDITTNSISLTIQAKGDNQIVRYYYSSNNGSSYSSSTSNSHIFSNLNKNTTYNISVYVEDNLGQQSNVYSFSVNTKNSLTFSEYIISLYNSQEPHNIYYHNNSLTNGAGDNSYRYSGSNPNNYVCFGSNESPCPNDNLYRIIGVFNNEVKLIKMTSIGNYQWDDAWSNTSWSQSELNRETLNGTFLNNLSQWGNKIVYHYWQVGEVEYNYDVDITPKYMYNHEVGSESLNTTYRAKIGLMYVSDFGYAASINYWTTSLASFQDTRNYNWLYLNDTEWTISLMDSRNSNAYYISNGNIGTSSSPVQNNYSIRPSFYLSSDIELQSGDGSRNNPYVIKI